MWKTPSIAREGGWDIVGDLFDRYISELEPKPPPFNERYPLTIVSDYGGKHKQSLVETYSFLVFQPEVQWDKIAGFSQARDRINDARRLKYNKLKTDAITRRLIIEMLPIWKNLDATLITIALDKTMLRRAATKPMLPEMHPEFRKRYAEFDERVRTHVMQVLSLVTFLARGFAPDDARVHWISDEDDVIASLRHRHIVSELFANLLHNWGCSSVDSTVSSVADNPKAWEDAISIVDVAAGAHAEQVTRFITDGNTWQDNTRLTHYVSGRCAATVGALLDKPAPLRYWPIWIRPRTEQGGTIATRFVSVELGEPNQTAKT
ncbi:MAG TPA: hypothetical protein VD971_12500 [Phycisphaerales bacterium]|nr:hypothetical protein [Phycisphaerales bacterium]